MRAGDGVALSSSASARAKFHSGPPPGRMLAVRVGGREGVLTTLVLPVAATVMFTLAALVHGSLRLAELVFVGVMFVAVWMRRFGPRAFAAGMAGFLGYFLALFLQVSFAALPAMAGAAAVGAGAALLARFVLLPERPDAAWRSGVRALRARVHTLLHAVDALGAEPGSTVRRRRVHDELLRLNATALSLGTTFAALDELPPERATRCAGTCWTSSCRRRARHRGGRAGRRAAGRGGPAGGGAGDRGARPRRRGGGAGVPGDRGPARRRRFPRGRHGGAPPAAAAADLGTATLTMQHDTDLPPCPNRPTSRNPPRSPKNRRSPRAATDDPHRDPGGRRRHRGDPRRWPGGARPVVLGGDHGVRGVRGGRQQPRRAARTGVVADLGHPRRRDSGCRGRES
jgi:hypothetical protein